MTTYSLLITIIPRNHGQKITDVAKQAGIPGATILIGRGTAKNSFLQIMGLGDTEKDITYMLIENEQKQKIFDTITKFGASQKSPYGILFSSPVNLTLKAGMNTSTEYKDHLNEEKYNMESEKTEKPNFELITAIINAGYADDAMAAARKAGAGGGTVINARGTGTEKDASFFGITIVPEKEILIILVEKTKSDDVLNAIKNLPCLSQQGSGIVYSSDVTDFVVLGKGNKKKE